MLRLTEIIIIDSSNDECVVLDARIHVRQSILKRLERLRE